jgi:hypothetical protein
MLYKGVDRRVEIFNVLLENEFARCTMNDNPRTLAIWVHFPICCNAAASLVFKIENKK